MLALIGAALLLLAAFGVELPAVDLVILGAAFVAAHFGITIPVWRGRT